MLLLRARNLKHYFGPRCIVDIPALDVYMGDRIGLLGRNGVGKTTLLKILLGMIKPDEGVVEVFGEAAYLPQLEEGAGASPDGALLRMWLGEGDVHANMSGGEETRVKLAHLFSKEAHLLVVDEPTTNLDMQGIAMLEDKLKRFSGAILLVSHDRELLDGVCSEIWELEQGKLTTYPGNYTDFLRLRQLKYETAMAEYEAYVREREHLQQAIRTQASKARSIKKAPSRMGISESRLHKGTAKAKGSKLEQSVRALESRLARLEVKEKPMELQGPTVDLQPPSPIGSEIALMVHELSVGFPGKDLLKAVSFVVRRGEKAALVGPNGTGKTTLLKRIVEGAHGVKLAGSVKLGWFSQGLEVLREDKTVLENVLETTAYRPELVRTVLARLLFRGDDVHKPVAVLSGGERVKCAFAKVFLADVNFLILDEPTNYLDIDSIEALGSVLQDYAGTVLFVSHDRRFIRQVANRILAVEDQYIVDFAGTYDEYQSRRRSADRSNDKLLVLQNRLAEITGRLAVPGPEDDMELLDQQFRELVEEIRRLKSQHS